MKSMKKYAEIRNKFESKFNQKEQYLLRNLSYHKADLAAEIKSTLQNLRFTGVSVSHIIVNFTDNHDFLYSKGYLNHFIVIFTSKISPINKK